MNKFMMALWVVIVRLVLLPFLCIAAIRDIIERVIHGESLTEWLYGANEAVKAFNAMCIDAIRNS